MSTRRAIVQSDFLFNLGDKVVIADPQEAYASLKDTRGAVVYRGYMDTIDSDCHYTNLYAIQPEGAPLVPGVPEGWLLGDPYIHVAQEHLDKIIENQRPTPGKC